MNSDDDRGDSYGNREARRDQSDSSDDTSSVDSPMEETGPLHLGPGFERSMGPPDTASVRSNNAVKRVRHPNKTKKERKKVKKQLRRDMASDDSGSEGIHDFGSEIFANNEGRSKSFVRNRSRSPSPMEESSFPSYEKAATEESSPMASPSSEGLFPSQAMLPSFREQIQMRTHQEKSCRMMNTLKSYLNNHQRSRLPLDQGLCHLIRRPHRIRLHQVERK